MREFLGQHVSKVFQSEPFKHWSVKKTVEDELDEPRTYYAFSGKGLELRCDRDDIVTVIFMYSEDHGGFEEYLFELPFSLKREQVLERLGTPSQQGEKFNDSILGECGAWDRFSQSDSTIHFEYKVDVDEINKITLMRSDVVP